MKNNTGTCEAELKICNVCPEKEQGQQRRWRNNFEKDYQQKKHALREWILATFFICCNALFLLGFLSGHFAKSITEKSILTAIFFCVISYSSRNRLDYRIVYGGMERPFIFSFGATLFFLGSLFAAQGIQYSGFSILCCFPGLSFFYQGYKEGPHYGWENYFRNRNAN